MLKSLIMKKFLLIFVGLIVCLLGASGLILEKIILSQLPKVVAAAGKNGTKISFDRVEGDSGFANTKLVFIRPRVETPKGVYQADEISLKVSLFSFRTLQGEISGSQSFNQMQIRSEPILFKVNLGAEKKITLTTKKLMILKPEKAASFQTMEFDGVLHGKEFLGTLDCTGVSLPIVPIQQFSEMNKAFLDISYQLGGREVMVRKSEFDFGEIQVAVRGRVQKDAFVLDAQVSGWEKILRELTARGFINETKQKIIATALNILSVRGVLRAPVILEDGVLRVGTYPLMKIKKD